MFCLVVAVLAVLLPQPRQVLKTLTQAAVVAVAQERAVDLAVQVATVEAVLLVPSAM
jgi:hypothetical protein